jgi:hypothetical protein
MKKAILIPILCAFIVFGCSDDTTNTDTTYGDTCTLTQNYDKKVSFITDGFGYNNLLVDFDVRGHAPAEPYDSTDTLIFCSLFSDAQGKSFRYEAVAGSSYGIKLGDEYGPMKLRVVTQKMESGEYSWGSNTDFGKSGVTFLPFANEDGMYAPVSGKTLIRFYLNDSSGKVDSMYGSFCGIVQNYRGERLNIHDGKFCLIRL